jgi:DNA-binding CsgD family transcriptional regulator
MVGMAFFWVYFRYQTFFQVLYPNTTSDSSEHDITLYLSVLLVLLVLCLASLRISPRIETAIGRKPMLIVASGCAGSIGAAFAIIANTGFDSLLLHWMSTPLVAIGFFGAYLVWARYFSAVFNAKAITVLAASYLLGLVLFSALAYIPCAKNVVAFLSPFCTCFCWFLLPHTEHADEQVIGIKVLPMLKKTDPYVLLFIAFLLAGSVVRGIVDTHGGSADIRWPLSMVMAAAVLVVCALYQKGRFFQGRAARPDDYMSVEGMVLKCWIALALFFFCGAFMCLLGGTYSIGGQIVVISRSILDFFLWVLLCNMIKHRKLPFLPVFVVCSILVETISWLISYVLTPRLLMIGDGGRMPTSDMLVLTIVFALLVLIIAFFGAVTLRSALNGATGQSADAPLDAESWRQIAEMHHLTAREIEVVGLFSQGNSIKKVASTLFISTSTAQSHIKSAYRKLDVHTRDELIEKLGNR